MKKTLMTKLIFVLIFVFTGACGSMSPDGTSLLSQNELGPDSVTETISAADGGTITSSSGKLKLTVSADALDEDTEFSITPMEAEDGLSWIFGPSGIQFNGDVWAYLVLTEDEFRDTFGEYEDLDGNPVDLLSLGVPLMVPSLESDDGNYEILDYTISRLENGAEHENAVVQEMIDDAPEGAKIVIAAKIQHFSIYRIRVFRHKPKSPDGIASEYIALDNKLDGSEEEEVNSPPFEYTYTLSRSTQTVKKKKKKGGSEGDKKEGETGDSKDEGTKEEEKPKTTDIITHEFYSKPAFTWKKSNYEVKGKGSLVSNPEVALNEEVISSNFDWPEVQCESEEGPFTLKAKATVNVRYGLVGTTSLTNKLVTLETSAVTECVAAEEEDPDYGDYYSDPESDAGLDSGEESVGANPFSGFDGQTFYAASGCGFFEFFTLGSYADGTVLSTASSDITLSLDGTALGVELSGHPYDLEMRIVNTNGLAITFTGTDLSCEQNFETY